MSGRAGSSRAGSNGSGSQRMQIRWFSEDLVRVYRRYQQSIDLVCHRDAVGAMKVDAIESTVASADHMLVVVRDRRVLGFGLIRYETQKRTEIMIVCAQPRNCARILRMCEKQARSPVVIIYSTEHAVDFFVKNGYKFYKTMKGGKPNPTQVTDKYKELSTTQAKREWMKEYIETKYFENETGFKMYKEFEPPYKSVKVPRLPAGANDSTPLDVEALSAAQHNRWRNIRGLEAKEMEEKEDESSRSSRRSSRRGSRRSSRRISRRSSRQKPPTPPRPPRPPSAASSGPRLRPPEISYYWYERSKPDGKELVNIFDLYEADFNATCHREGGGGGEDRHELHDDYVLQIGAIGREVAGADQMVVVTVDGRIAGFGCIKYESSKNAHIKILCASLRGMGQQILQRMEKQAKRRYITLYAVGAAASFYAKHGYVFYRNDKDFVKTKDVGKTKAFLDERGGLKARIEWLRRHDQFLKEGEGFRMVKMLKDVPWKKGKNQWPKLEPLPEKPIHRSKSPEEEIVPPGSRQPERPMPETEPEDDDFDEDAAAGYAEQPVGAVVNGGAYEGVQMNAPEFAAEFGGPLLPDLGEGPPVWQAYQANAEIEARRASAERRRRQREAAEAAAEAAVAAAEAQEEQMAAAPAGSVDLMDDDADMPNAFDDYDVYQETPSPVDQQPQEEPQQQQPRQSVQGPSLPRVSRLFGSVAGGVGDNEFAQSYSPPRPVPAVRPPARPPAPRPPRANDDSESWRRNAYGFAGEPGAVFYRKYRDRKNFPDNVADELPPGSYRMGQFQKKCQRYFRRAEVGSRFCVPASPAAFAIPDPRNFRV